jgi:zinc/manganese transport system substrate-binding protein
MVAATAVAAMTVLAGCGSAVAGSDAVSASETGGAAAKLSVVTSTNVYGNIAGQIAGDRAAVTSLISSPDADPHEFEASPHDQLALSRADLVIENGGGYDDFVDTMLGAVGRQITVLNAVNISGKKAQGGELNEHVWYDLSSMITLADRIAAALTTLDPAGADIFSANAADFRSEVQKLVAQTASISHVHHGEGVAITEPVPLYLLQACGLDNRTPEGFSEAVEDDTDVPPLILQRTLDLFAAGRVALLVYNEQTTGPATQRVLDAAKEHHIPVVPVTETLPAGQDYQSWMHANLTAIQRALDRTH